MRNAQEMQVSKSFKNSLYNWLNGQQTKILRGLLIKMRIGINIDMHITNSIRQEVSDNIQKVFFIVLSPQEMTVKLNNICAFVLHFYFFKSGHLPLLVFPIVK